MPISVGELVAKFGLDPKGLQKGLKAAGQSLRSIGKQISLSVTAPLAAAAGLSVKASLDFESAWAGVRKTVEGTPAQLQAIQDDLVGLTRTMPATAVEFFGVAEAAGQLGVATPDVARFTETMIKLGEASGDLDAESAAQGIARFTNITGTAAELTENLASTIVELGNTTATTEGEILEMALRIAGTGKAIGLTEDKILGGGWYKYLRSLPGDGQLRGRGWGCAGDVRKSGGHHR
jgi:hypothetical protein